MTWCHIVPTGQIEAHVAFPLGDNWWLNINLQTGQIKTRSKGYTVFDKFLSATEGLKLQGTHVLAGH